MWITGCRSRTLSKMEINELLNDAVRKAQQGREEIIKGAFLEHFGVPIETIDDIQNLERIVQHGNPVSSYRYRGETFLFLKEEFDFSFSRGHYRRSFTITVSYSKV